MLAGAIRPEEVPAPAPAPPAPDSMDVEAPASPSFAAGQRVVTIEEDGRTPRQGKFITSSPEIYEAWLGPDYRSGRDDYCDSLYASCVATARWLTTPHVADEASSLGIGLASPRWAELLSLISVRFPASYYVAVHSRKLQQPALLAR